MPYLINSMTGYKMYVETLTPQEEARNLAIHVRDMLEDVYMSDLNSADKRAILGKLDIIIELL